MSRSRRNEYREREYAVAWRESLVQSAEAAAMVESHGPSLGRLMLRELAGAWTACGMFEWVALGYLGVSSVLILSFAENLVHPVRLIGMQVSVAAVILVLCWVEARKRADRSVCSALRFWRCWYPHLFFLFCFEELGRLVHLVQPGWQDAKLMAFDHGLTGVNPSLWLERFSHPALNEFMQFAYFSYFLFLLILGAILYHRREWESYWAVMTYSAVGYSLGYIIAMLFPVESPWFTFAGMWHGELAGGPFTAVIDF